MKNLKKLLSICLALMMVLTCVPAAFAAEVDDCTINEDAKQQYRKKPCVAVCLPVLFLAKIIAL